LVLLVLPFFTLNSWLIAARLKPLLNRMARILVSCIPKQIALAELGGGSMNTAPGLQCSFTEGSFLCSHFVLCDSLSYWWKWSVRSPCQLPGEECSKAGNKFYLHLMSCSSLKVNLSFILPCCHIITITAMFSTGQSVLKEQPRAIFNGWWYTSKSELPKCQTHVFYHGYDGCSRTKGIICHWDKKINLRQISAESQDGALKSYSSLRRNSKLLSVRIIQAY